MLKRRLALIAGVVLAGSTVVAPAAQAGVQANCATPAYGCLYYDTAFGGEVIEINGRIADLGRDSNQAESGWNATTSYLVLFDETNLRGVCLSIAPRAAVSQLPIHFRNKASSVAFFQVPPAQCLRLGS